jgi:hypothetical protein
MPRRQARGRRREPLSTFSTRALLHVSIEDKIGRKIKRSVGSDNGCWRPGQRCAVPRVFSRSGRSALLRVGPKPSFSGGAVSAFVTPGISIIPNSGPESAPGNIGQVGFCAKGRARLLHFAHGRCEGFLGAFLTHLTPLRFSTCFPAAAEGPSWTEHCTFHRRSRGRFVRQR